MPGGFMTCTEMFGNGVRTGIALIHLDQSPIRTIPLPAVTASYAADPGSAAQRSAARPTASRPGRRSGPTP